MNARRAFDMIVALGFASLAGGCSAHRYPTPSAATGPNVPLIVARIGTIERTVDVQGRVGSPNGDSAKIAFAEPGILQSIAVRVGQHVSAGQPLAEIDRAPLAAPVAQAAADERAANAAYEGGNVGSAALRSANARLAVALAKLRTLQGGGPAATSGRIEAVAVAQQADLKLQADRATVARQLQLFDAGVIARKDLEAARLQEASDAADLRNARVKTAVSAIDAASAFSQARADVSTARSDVAAARPQNMVLSSQADSARAKLDAARVAYDNGIVAAPADGVVLAILKHPGEAVDTASPVIEIGPTSAGIITLTAPAATAQEVAIGDPVTIRIPGRTVRAANGRITSIVGSVDGVTQSVTILAGSNPSGAIAGDAVAATIAVGSERGVIVPQSAIIEDPETGNTVVFVHRASALAKDSAFEMRSVTLGAGNASNIVVSSGLHAGESIAAQGGYALLAPIGGA